MNLFIKKVMVLLVMTFLFSCHSEKSITDVGDEVELDAFGKKIESLFSDQDQNALLSLLYLQPTLDIIKANLTREDKTRLPKDFWEDSRKFVYGGLNSYMEELRSQVNYDGEISYSNSYRDSLGAHIVFLIESESVGMDLIEFDIISIDDDLKISNFRSYYKGMDYSQYFVTDIFLRLDYGWYRGPYIESLGRARNARNFLERGMVKAAIKEMEKIQDDFRYDPNVIGCRTRLAKEISDSMYVSELYDWISYNWDFKGFRYLRGSQYYRMIGDSTAAANYIDSLEILTGQNKLIQSLRSID